MADTLSGISKSQYLKGLQCPKALWFYRHRPDLRPEVSSNQQALFDAGHEVGELAQTYFQNGVLIAGEYYELAKAINATEAAIAGGATVIYEAAAAAEEGAYSRIDIFRQVRGADDWDLVEVKMSTAVKTYHLDDMSLQRYAFEKAGHKIRKSILMHIDNQYVRQGGLDIKQLFMLEDCTPLVEPLMAEVGETVGQLIEMLKASEAPPIEIGDHCHAPFACDFTHHCWHHIPDYSVYNLFSGAKLEALLARDVLEVKDVPDDVEVTARQAIEIQAVKSGRVHADQEGIRTFLERIEYPLYYLDYETIGPAVPLYEDSRPYQQIPFQFSLHIQAEHGGPLEHTEFLHAEAGDPRPGFIAALLERCGNQGAVMVYNQAFESRINRELGQYAPVHKPALDAITSRMVDLLIPFRSRLLYHPEMRGSASLKAVLPAFVPDLSYADLAIGDGGAASNHYLSLAKGIVDAEERAAILANLKAYCHLDTLAEVRLLEVLYAYGQQ